MSDGRRGRAEGIATGVSDTWSLGTTSQSLARTSTRFPQPRRRFQFVAIYRRTLDRVSADGSHPRCDRCRVLMRDIPGGYRCPSCGHVLTVTRSIQQPTFTGPAIRGG